MTRISQPDPVAAGRDLLRRQDAAREARYLIRKQPGAAGHWLWPPERSLKATSPGSAGYAYINREHRDYLVARLLWEDEYGEPPRRLRRYCDEPRCVKPDHMELIGRLRGSGEPQIRRHGSVEAITAECR